MLPHTSPLPAIGQTIIILPTVDSTNNYAMAQIRNGTASHGSSFLALEQTEGKGQRGKSWESSTGLNIMMSTVIQAQPQFTTFPFLISATIALAVSDFFQQLTLPEDVRMKWPNDLYWQDRKAGGILIEAIRSSDDASGLKWLVVGIGININQTHFERADNRPVSLKQITGKDGDIALLSHQLCALIEKRFQDLLKLPPQAIMSDYNEVLYKKGQLVTLKTSQQIFDTQIVGVDIDGQLITKDTFERKWRVGEVTLHVQYH